MQTSDLHIESSRSRRALLVYVLFMAGGLGLHLLRGRPLEDLVGFAVGGAVGIFGISALMQNRYFRATTDYIEGPPSIGWKAVSIPRSDLCSESLRRTVWDRFNGVRKIRGHSGRAISISFLDFTQEQRDKIEAQLRSMIEMPDNPSAHSDAEPSK